MLQPEKNYDFKAALLQIHRKDWRDPELRPEEDEFEITEGVRILLPPDADEVIVTAARDFQDYLLSAMDISAMVTKRSGPGQSIRLALSRDLEEEARGYMGYRIEVTGEGIALTGYDNVGIAQGLYFLEDLMDIRRAPFLKKGVTARKSLFEFRPSHSPFGMFEYPDEAFSLLAHRGYNIIELWMKDAYTSKRGDFVDVNLICRRAKKYGIKVYVELYALNEVYPDTPEAEAYYDKLYGEFFTACPDIAGVVLVGEAAEFHSKDPHVGKAPYCANIIDGIPTGKRSPGWWPCCDYYKLIEAVKKAVRKYKPDADVVACTYNWGWAPEEDRIKLIDSLPTDISLLATWDMFQKQKRGNSVACVMDYSLQFAGPGDYFASEAKACKRRGIRLYTIGNASGRTWDFGVIPYEPMPFQWIRRYEAMQKAHAQWGMIGVSENIHYAFQPSIIGDLEKWAFFGEKDLLGILDRLLVRDHGKDAYAVREAFRCFSEAITHHSTAGEDQYGVFRVGPSYPFWIFPPSNGGKVPERKRAMFGSGIYTNAYPNYLDDYGSICGVRIFDELAELRKMQACFEEGIAILQALENPNDETLRLCNLAKFLRNTTVSGIHNKEFYILKQQLHIAGTQENAGRLLDEIEALLTAERQNAQDTIPIVQVDSRLGWEPSMEYTTDEAGLLWKLRQIDYELSYTIPMFRRANAITVEEADS